MPFDHWLSEGKQSNIRWSVDVSPARLSTHQRLILHVSVRVDGRELEKRRGNGQLLVLAQFDDDSGGTWQNHTGLNLESLRPGLQNQEISISFYAFVLPGDYQLSVAICDSASLEHSFTKRKVHVAPLKSDPLPDSWKGLPPVEFISGETETPDVWFLPEVSGRLHLPLAARRPVHLEVLVNTTPSQRASGSMSAMKRNMSVLIPALKVISQIDLRGGSLDTALLDLTHRKVTYEQKNVSQLKWDEIRRVFHENNPGIVDVHTLEGQWKMRKFFWDEVSRRLTVEDGKIHVIMVLSGPAFFEDQEPVEPVISRAHPDRRLFYIRYRTVPQRPDRPRLRPGIRPTLPGPPLLYPMGVDDLERTLEPLDARLFDAVSAEEFRRVLAAVLEQIPRD